VDADGSFASLFNFRKMLESIQFFWDRYVLIFSAQDQLDAIQSIRDEYRRLGSRAKEKYGSLPEVFSDLKQFWKKFKLSIGFAAGAILILFVAFRLWWQRRRRLQVSSTPVLFYGEMLKILENKGFSRDPSSTPAEFVEHIRLHLPESIQPDVFHLTELFYRARFGNYPLNRTEVGEVEASLQRLQQL
jgi:hypothetical protein